MWPQGVEGRGVPRWGSVACCKAVLQILGLLSYLHRPPGKDSNLEARSLFQYLQHASMVSSAGGLLFSEQSLDLADGMTAGACKDTVFQTQQAKYYKALAHQQRAFYLQSERIAAACPHCCRSSNKHRDCYPLSSLPYKPKSNHSSFSPAGALNHAC